VVAKAQAVELELDESPVVAVGGASQPGEGGGPLGVAPAVLPGEAEEEVRGLAPVERTAGHHERVALADAELVPHARSSLSELLGRRRWVDPLGHQGHAVALDSVLLVQVISNGPGHDDQVVGGVEGEAQLVGVEVVVEHDRELVHVDQHRRARVPGQHRPERQHVGRRQGVHVDQRRRGERGQAQLQAGPGHGGAAGGSVPSHSFETTLQQQLWRPGTPDHRGGSELLELGEQLATHGGDRGEVHAAVVAQPPLEGDQTDGRPDAIGGVVQEEHVDPVPWLPHACTVLRLIRRGRDGRRRRSVARDLACLAGGAWKGARLPVWRRRAQGRTTR